MANRFSGVSKVDASAFKRELKRAQQSMNRDEFVGWCERRNIRVIFEENSFLKPSIDRWIAQGLFGAFFWVREDDGYNSYPVTPRINWKMCENPTIEEDASTKMMRPILQDEAEKREKRKKKLAMRCVMKEDEVGQDNGDADTFVIGKQRFTKEERIVKEWMLYEERKARKERGVFCQLKNWISKGTKVFGVSPCDISLRNENGPFGNVGVWFYEEKDMETLKDVTAPVSVEAVWHLLYMKVGTYNWSQKKEHQISLLHPSYVTRCFGGIGLDEEPLETSSDSFNVATSACKSLNVERYLAYRRNDTRRILVPVLKSDGQYVVFLVERVKEQYVYVHFFDSSMEKYVGRPFDYNMDLADYVVKLVMALFPLNRCNICFFQAEDQSIHVQRSVNESGLHVIRNVEGIMARKGFLKNAVNISSRVRDNPFVAIGVIMDKERARLVEELKLLLAKDNCL